MKKIRCAIYTRKSAEEGLEQDFNSLDAQREACAAYVASQKADGWVLLPTVYEDGVWKSFAGASAIPARKAMRAKKCGWNFFRLIYPNAIGRPRPMSSIAWGRSASRSMLSCSTGVVARPGANR